MSISEITSERYERSPRVSDEIAYRGTEQANNEMNIKTAIRILFVFFLVDPFSNAVEFS